MDLPIVELLWFTVFPVDWEGLADFPVVLEGLEEALLTTLTLQLASFPLYVLTVTHAVPVFTALNCPLQLVFVIETIFLLLVRNVRFEEAESDESIEFKEPVCPALRVKLD